MSIDLQKRVWDDPEPKGPAKAVLVHLAWYVKKDAWDRGRDLLSWPSQNTIAVKCGIRRSTVERALKSLVDLGKIKDTGIRRQRGTVVWELYPSTAADVKAGWELADLPDDLPGSDAGPDDLPGSEAGGGGAPDDLPGSRHDLPDLQSDLPASEASTCPPPRHKREGRGENNGERSEREGARGARDPDSDLDLADELATVEALLANRPADKLLSGRRDELRDSLGAPA